ncbi:uncharacterized protein ARMOST_21160 [Armillaria ostoyae]|uniref:Uncharacterized protein n=1 Tax=Armillaria ostoyae TaxID=47428 RepID=A0A284S9G6_ARMOS|nr:uncharacterized protein ARMOST_21160 [Armillaria ostoyae]
MPTLPSTLNLADVFATRLTTRWRLHHDHQPVEEETKIVWFDAQRTEYRPIRGHGFRFSVDGDQLIHPNLLCLEEHWNYSFPVLLQAKEVGVQNPPTISIAASQPIKRIARFRARRLTS